MNDPYTSSGQETRAVPLDNSHQHHHTIVPIHREPPPPKLRCLKLLHGSGEEYMKVGVPLYEAAIKGDWKAAKPILDKQPDLVRFAITENYDTLLHIAASAESTKSVVEFVTELVQLMENKDLELRNKNSNTALSLAAAAGNVETAKIMLRKNPGLAEIPGNNRTMPLYMAALFEKPVMVRYLYDISGQMSGKHWYDGNRGSVLRKCVEAEIFDVAIKIVTDRPELTEWKGPLLMDVFVALAQITYASHVAITIAKDRHKQTERKRLLSDVLVALAQKTDAFEGTKPNVVLRIIKSIFLVKVGSRERECEALTFLRIICRKIAKMHKYDILDIIRGPLIRTREQRWPSRVLFLATKAGNTRFIIELIRSNPDLIWKKDDKKRTVFHLAVKHRQINIYKLIYEIGAMKDIITPITDIKGNNMLHMVGKKAKQKHIQNVSGAALEMQRELSWFKEVEQMIPSSIRERKNNAGQTPRDLFAKEHAYLVSKGEDWMNNYMLVATLIATIVFAAAFTLPGGYNQDTGIPFFSKEPSLIIFVISDAVSLISSSTSVLIFLSILTARYAERDSMQSLPTRLMFGIATLFLSIVTMMIAFSSSFFILYHEKLKWMPIAITSLAGLPVILFAKMQFHLLMDVFDYTYRSRYHFKPKKRTLYFY